MALPNNRRFPEGLARDSAEHMHAKFAAWRQGRGHSERLAGGRHGKGQGQVPSPARRLAGKLPKDTLRR